MNRVTSVNGHTMLEQSTTKWFPPDPDADPKAYIGLGVSQAEFDRVCNSAATGWRCLISMRRIAIASAVAILGFACAKVMAADGATAPYNEAVQIVNGKRVVDVAPFPEHMKSAVSTFRRPSEHAPLTSELRAIETPQGLMDCAGTAWYHPKACSPSTFGREKRMRTWMVKMNGKWFGCVSQAKPTRCVPIIVDGKLRPLPSVEE